MKRLPLRVRVSLAYGLMGLLLTIGFAVATMFVAEDYEAIIIESMLDGQAKTYFERLREDPAATLPVTEGFAGYREEDAPVRYRGWPDGIHDLEDEEVEGLHLGVVGEPGARLVFLVNVGHVEVLERYLIQAMLIIVLGGTAASAWLGWLLAQRTIAPVAQLANAVDALPMRPLPTALMERFGRDEIGRLAGAIDAYQQRLVDVDAVDRTFFANASHELRTPIAVIQGAVEVMKDDPSLRDAQSSRMDRIDRALLELGSLLEALLLSARRQRGEDDPIDFATLVDEAIARIAPAVPDARDRISVSGPGGQDLRAPPRWVASILTVLLQRILLRSPGSRWSLALDPTGLTLSRIDGTLDEESASGRSDLGLGLMFVERLCRDLDWRLEQGRDAAGRATIRVDGQRAN